MARIVGAILTTHAYTFVDPNLWEERRARRTRPNYAKQYGDLPPERPEIATETLSDNLGRYASIRLGFEQVRRRLDGLSADTLVIIGNDQDENFTPESWPQFAVFSGERFVIRSRAGSNGALTWPAGAYNGAPLLARTILERALEAGFDPAIVARFKDDALESHAHREPLQFYGQGSAQNVLPIFVNAIHLPAPSPARCYAFGRMLRAAIESDANSSRVVLLASGGLSHFPADYPWPDYSGPLTLGAVCADFDRRIVEHIRGGNGAALASLSNDELMANGEGELRQTIVMLGALGEVVPAVFHYEPFHRAIMGMAIGCWDLT